VEHAVKWNTADASSAVSANTETQSSERQAGTTPRVLKRPRVGFSPTMLLKAAGTRPDPAVSVPRAKLTRPAATATAEPELEPPGMWHAVRRARARQSGGELIEIGLAQQHGTGLKQSGHDGGRCRRGIGERGAGRGGRHARDIDIVLNRKRNAEEWQALD
jgi:hypothetical protein